MIDITPILLAILTLCVTVITIVVVPRLKAQLGQEKINEALAKVTEVQNVIKILVSAAEQMFPEAGTGEQRKEYVMAQIKAWLNENGITADLNLIDAQVEAAVLEINQQLKSETEA